MTIETRLLTGTALLADGSPSHGSILLNPADEIMDSQGDPLVSITPRRILFDKNGSFSFAVVPSDVDPDRIVPYFVQERFGDYRSYYVTIPSGPGPIDLFRDLAPLGDLPDIPGAYATQSALQAVTARVDTLDQEVGQGAPDASSTTKGLVRLANELAGTADSPELADPLINLSVLFDNALF